MNEIKDDMINSKKFLKKTMKIFVARLNFHLNNLDESIVDVKEKLNQIDDRLNNLEKKPNFKEKLLRR